MLVDDSRWYLPISVNIGTEIESEAVQTESAKPRRETAPRHWQECG